jgi:hypothetical protein
MSHHYSGPDLGFPGGDARLDFTDLYAFPKPGDPSKSIIIMNVHPSVGLQPPGPTTAEAFAPEALYELKIDTDGDAVADIAYQVRFASSGQGQTATLRRLEGAQAAGTGEGGQDHRRGRAGLDRAGGARDSRRRLSLLRGLAQRSLLLRHAGRDQ